MLYPETKAKLDKLKIHPNQSYDEVIRELLTAIPKKEVSQLARGLRTRLTDMGDLDPKLVEFLKQKNAQVTSLPQFLALVREYNSQQKETQKCFMMKTGVNSAANFL